MIAIIKFTLRYCLVVSMCLSTLIGRSQADWIVIPSDYEYNMNVIGVGFIECDAIHDEQDRIAAFVGDEIRGVQFFNVESNQGLYVYMFIYSNRFSGDTIHFKIYDASKDRIYELSNRMVFLENAVVGSEQMPVQFTTVNQTLNIEPDTNQILRQSNVGDKIANLQVKNGIGQVLLAGFEWIHDSAGIHNHYFEFVGQELFIKERIVDFPENEIQIHFKVNVSGMCVTDQLLNFKISDLTATENETEQPLIDIFPNPTVDYFQIRSNVLFDHVYLMDPLKGSMREVEQQKPIYLTSGEYGLKYIIFKKGSTIWKKPLLHITEI